MAIRLDRITGPDRTGTAFAVVDAVGRFLDISLLPVWPASLGPARVAAGLLEALETARLKAALVPLILRRVGHFPSPIVAEELSGPLPPVDDGGFLDAARGRIAEAYRLIDDADDRLRERQAERVIAGPRGLFRLRVRGSRIQRAEVAAGLTAADTDRLVADAREALTELTRLRWEM
ncbi:hypothetical protein ACQP2F_42085 [Actinoplanes sp. CA-030573]|uniref:hypothetical protein n=1 Tax=Actinoplanes sp. CA-030573 TaxID=3239898 RepID=UPI003D89C507